MRGRIEMIGFTFREGYHHGLESVTPTELTDRLECIGQERRGFAFEGAAMALALRDLLTPWRHHRVEGFLAGAGERHAYMVHVGVGWAVARWPLWPRRWLSQFDTLLRWLIYDGFGFHEGFFHCRDYTAGRAAPRSLRGYERRAFDQGLGRCLWFADGGDVGRIPATIQRFPADRHADLWSGVGLACAYAGIVEDADALRALQAASGAHRHQLGQGAAFAAKARARAGNEAPHTETVCHILCGLSAAAAAAATDEALDALVTRTDEPEYETWRREVAARLARVHASRRVAPASEHPRQLQNTPPDTCCREGGMGGKPTLTPTLSHPMGEGGRTLTPSLSHPMGEGD